MFKFKVKTYRAETEQTALFWPRDEAKEISEAIARSVVPLSNGDAERPFMVPRGHDAYDIWYCIINKVTNPQDILALWNVCFMFQEILTRGNRYVHVRLPHIDLLICNARPLCLLEEEIDSPSKITLLNLRFISKLCKTSLEVLIQSDDPTKFYSKPESTDKVQGIIDEILGNMIRKLEASLEILHRYSQTLIHVALHLNMYVIVLASRAAKSSQRHQLCPHIQNNPRKEGSIAIRPNSIPGLNGLPHSYVEASRVDLDWIKCAEEFEWSSENELIKFDGGRYDL